MRAMAFTLLLLPGCLLPVAQGTGGGTAPTSGSTMEGGGPSSSSGSSSSGSSSSSSSGMSHGAEPARTTPAAPAAPTTASVTIRSSCSKTAKVFYGEKPGFSSGTTSSVSSNSVSSKTFRVGDLMWVLDDSGKPLGSVQIAASTRQVEIQSDCSTISGR